jgi:hypothetical protein
MMTFMISVVPPKTVVMRVVGVRAGDGVFEHVAVAAEELDTAVDDALVHFGGPPLGLRRVHRVEGVAVQLEHGFVDVGLCHLELSQHLGNGELGVLELRDGPAECLPLRKVVQRPGKRRTGARAGGDGDAQAFEREVQ